VPIDKKRGGITVVMTCPSCGAENPDDAQYCNLCLSTVGFECVEFAAPVIRDEGYSCKYPSSFDDDAPAPVSGEGSPPPVAGPVDIGEYGIQSGEAVTPKSPVLKDEAPPVDVGQYGRVSGHAPHEPPPPQTLKESPAGPPPKKRRRRKR